MSIIFIIYLWLNQQGDKMSENDKKMGHSEEYFGDIK